MVTRSELDNIVQEAQSWSLNVRPAMRVASVRVGDFLSAYIGEGSEFEEIREYTPGDPLRRIHMPTTVRLGELMVVTQREERELRVLCVLDATPSMMLRKKTHTAFSALTMLMSSCIKSRIPCGLWVFGKTFDFSFPTRASLDHLYRCTAAVLDVLENKTDQLTYASGEFSFAQKAEHLPRGSIIFVVSDFINEPNLVASCFDWARHEVVPVIIQDELEYTFPTDFSAIGASTLMVDSETGRLQKRWINKRIARKIKKKNEERFNSFTQKLDQRFRSYAHLATPKTETIWRSLDTTLHQLATKYQR